MRDGISFKSFYGAVLLKSKTYPSMTEQMLSRRTQAPRRIEISTGEPVYPPTTQAYYKRLYFEAIDLMVNPIDQRFDQPSFDTYARTESLLVKTLNSQGNSTELQYLWKKFMVTKKMLTGQIEF